jgi:D-alanyl-D-alanine dipeptidase
MKLIDILQRPVPDFAGGRKRKVNFREYPIQTAGVHSHEPLVDISLYGIAGQSYYSRPNGASGEPIKEIASTVYVRESVAKRLAAINHALQQSAEATELFSGQVELFVNEGYRSPELQQKLYDEIFPELIRAQHPDYSDTEVKVRRDQLIAAPVRADSPSPHATGGAVDVRLRYTQPSLDFVADKDVVMGRQATDTSNSVYPDYFENLKKLTKQDQLIQKHRRAFYWIMRGALNGDNSGFTVNPNEWWHWSYGDQMWAQLTNAPEAFFALASLI